jgi:hypothetical protein
MHTLARVRTGLAVLGRIHALLQALSAGPAAAPRFANYVAATGLVQAVAAGTRRIRAWLPTPAEARLADLADRLAETLAGWDLDCPVPVCRRQVGLVTDFDSGNARGQIWRSRCTTPASTSPTSPATRRS